MTKTIDWQGIKKLHREKFGVDPVITGALFWSSDTLLERVLDAIAKGEPYIEDPVPDGVDI